MKSNKELLEEMEEYNSDKPNLKEDLKHFKHLLWIIPTGLVLLVVIFGCFYTVPAGHKGVLLTFGKPTMVAQGEGFHFKIPIAQSVQKVEVRTQKTEVTADSASKDLQDVQTIIALNFHVSPENSPSLYKEIGMGYIDRIITPSIQESVKGATAQFTAEQLITKRPEVRIKMKELLKERLNKYWIVVDDFNIVDFKFSEEFDKAIESKVTAEQLKLKAEMDLERIKVEKQQMITQAEAQAESLRLQKMEVTPELIELRKIENQKTAIEKWDGILPQVTSGMPFFDVSTTMVEKIGE